MTVRPRVCGIVASVNFGSGDGSTSGVVTGQLRDALRVQARLADFLAARRDLLAAREDFFVAREDFLGTRAPSRRASESPIAMAWRRLVTLRPERPLRSEPDFILRMTRPTLRPARLL